MSSLFEIGFGVDLDLFRRQRRTGRVAAGRIANGGRKVTDQEDHRVAEILQLTKLIEHHRVTDVNVGSRGIQTELATQLGAGRLGAGQLLVPVALARASFCSNSLSIKSVSVPRAIVAIASLISGVTSYFFSSVRADSTDIGMEFQKSFFIQRLRHIRNKRSDIVPNAKESSSNSSQRWSETALSKMQILFSHRDSTVSPN